MKTKQRYKCKQCAYNFSIDKLKHGIDQRYVKQCLQLYLEGMGFSAIERVVGVSHVSVINWVKRYGQALKKVTESGKNISAVELDELCSYVGSKKKLWVWLAVDRADKQVLGFTLGDRSAATGDKLYKSLSDFEISSYYTDYWTAYESVLYKEHHVRGKAGTYTVENMNGLVRHYLARFQRRSKCYAKSIAMVEYSLKLLLNKLSIEN